MKRWQLHQARNRLSELVRKEGPQVITLRGKDAVVVIGAHTYRKLTAPRKSLAAFFRESPLAQIHLQLARDTDPGRKVDLRAISRSIAT